VLIDCHCHIFTKRIVENMLDRPNLVQELKLNVRDAWPRLHPSALQDSAKTNGIQVCVLLPTASPDKVRVENDRFIGWTKELSMLRTLATLHPSMPALSDEILRIFGLGIPGFKLSSFSQRFDLASPEVETMLRAVERLAEQQRLRPIVVLDTFARAHSFFGTNPRHTTHPSHVTALVTRHPGIDFIAAHMGGLLADPDELVRDLVPASNLYLDTSNAAHTLPAERFIQLLQVHGSSRILFGTDWPWFVHASEVAYVRSLLDRAGYDTCGQAAVFGENSRRLFGL
jgi:uncharacterized protein